MDLQEARDFLNGMVRGECRDHCFGDREVTWWKPEDVIDGDIREGAEPVADGYFGRTGQDVTIGKTSFSGSDAYELVKCGASTIVERNDSQGDDIPRYIGA